MLTINKDMPGILETPGFDLGNFMLQVIAPTDQLLKIFSSEEETLYIELANGVILLQKKQESEKAIVDIQVLSWKIAMKYVELVYQSPAWADYISVMTKSEFMQRLLLNASS